MNPLTGKLAGEFRGVCKRAGLDGPCALDTTDRAEFKRHMEEAHRGDRALFRYSTAYHPRRWLPPKLSEEGLPFKSRDAVTEQCPRCELISERPHDHAGELWWSEHLERCVGEAQVAS